MSVVVAFQLVRAEDGEPALELPAAVQLLELWRMQTPEGGAAPGRTLALTKATIGVKGTYTNTVSSWCTGLVAMGLPVSAKVFVRSWPMVY